MVIQNADGSIQYAFNTDGSLSTITRDPDFVGPIATTSSGVAGNAFNDPKPAGGSWFDSAVQNLNDLGTSVYDLGVAGYSKIKANVSRLSDASTSVSRAVQSGLAAVSPGPALSSAGQAVSDTAKSVGDFFQSTLWKILLILIVGATITLFLMSYIQTKAGRLANA